MKPWEKNKPSLPRLSPFVQTRVILDIHFTTSISFVSSIIGAHENKRSSQAGAVGIVQYRNVASRQMGTCSFCTPVCWYHGLFGKLGIVNIKKKHRAGCSCIFKAATVRTDKQICIRYIQKKVLQRTQRRSFEQASRVSFFLIRADPLLLLMCHQLLSAALNHAVISSTFVRCSIATQSPHPSDNGRTNIQNVIAARIAS